MISIYNVGRWGKKGDRIDKIIEEREMNKIIIGADFNIRIGELDSIEIKEGGYGRSSKDKVIGNEDRKLLEWIKEKRWYVLNGSMKGDWNWEYTFVGARGNTVIDYVIVNEEALEKVEEFKIDR